MAPRVAKHERSLPATKWEDEVLRLRAAASRVEWQLASNDGERIQRAAVRAALGGATGEFATADAIRALFPTGLAARLRGFAMEGSSLGAFLIANLPIDDLDGNSKRSRLSEALLLVVATIMGEPSGSEGQRGGRLIHNLVPIAAHAHEQLGTSPMALTWHSENAHAADIPDVIALLCLRGDPAATTFVSLVDVRALDADTLRALARDAFIIRPDASFSDATHSTSQPVPCAVVSGAGACFRVRFDPAYTTCLDEAAELALERFAEHVERNAVGVTLRTGDMLLIDNRRAVHARAAFRPRYDGTDRWIQRVVVHCDVARA